MQTSAFTRTQAYHAHMLKPYETCRMDDLVGDEFQIVSFRHLPVTHQLAIAHYLSIDCGSWQCFYEGDEPSLGEYVREYGDQSFGVIDLPSQRVTQSVMADRELATTFTSWEQYAAWYCAAGDVPEHDSEHRWPVILSQDNEETLRDGWHRFHCYMRSGCNNIPAVFFPAERHYELSQRNGAAHSAPLGVLDDSPGLGM